MAEPRAPPVLMASPNTVTKNVRARCSLAPCLSSPHPCLFKQRCTLCPPGGEGPSNLSGPIGNATNWILPDICDQDAEELPNAAATHSVPSLLLVTARHCQKRPGLQPLLAVA
ncbi:Protein Smg9 [Manis pentadactyla]|nr:Protein Smg9 [Manis pentadactyla]